MNFAKLILFYILILIFHKDIHFNTGFAWSLVAKTKFFPENIYDKIAATQATELDFTFNQNTIT